MAARLTKLIAPIDSMKYISRIDTKGAGGGHHSWRCAIKILGIDFSVHKTFTDIECGGKDAGLLAAKAWRAKQVKAANKKLDAKYKPKTNYGERTLQIKSHAEKCRLPIGGETLMVLSFVRFKEMCIERQEINMKKFHQQGKFQTCISCEVGYEIKEGTRKTLPINVALIDRSTITLPISKKKKKKKVIAKKKVKVEKEDIELLSDTELLNIDSSTDKDESIDIHSEVTIPESFVVENV